MSKTTDNETMDESKKFHEIKSVRITFDDHEPLGVKVTDQDDNPIYCYWPIEIHIDQEDGVATLRVPIESIEFKGEVKIEAASEVRMSQMAKIDENRIINAVRKAIKEKKL